MTEFDAAREALERGLPVVVPTETVYGLAALPGVPGAVESLFALKERPDTKPVAILAADARDLSGIAVFDDRAERLAARFWPGPLTLVLGRAPGFDRELGGGGDTVGVRVPNHSVALALLAATGPLAVTSANRTGEPPAHTIDAAREAFGDRVAVYVDAGDCAGVPSTVVALVGRPEILREGAIERAVVAESLV